MWDRPCRPTHIQGPTRRETEFRLECLVCDRVTGSSDQMGELDRFKAFVHDLRGSARTIQARLWARMGRSGCSWLMCLLSGVELGARASEGSK